MRKCYRYRERLSTQQLPTKCIHFEEKKGKIVHTSLNYFDYFYRWEDYCNLNLKNSHPPSPRF